MLLIKSDSFMLTTLVSRLPAVALDLRVFLLFKRFIKDFTIALRV